MAAILGFDPGRDKCGVAVTIDGDRLACHETVAAENALAWVGDAIARYGVAVIAIGDRTASRAWQEKLRAAFPNVAIAPVDERYSTQEARRRYWQMYPPRGWGRLLPAGMRVVPRPVDDIVAIVLIERYRQHAATPQKF